MSKEIINKVAGYYSDKIKTHGASSKGVDWNGKESHYLRFQQLCKILMNNPKDSLMDYGCGYGSLLNYLEDNRIQAEYFGYDISDEMIFEAKNQHKSLADNFMTSLPPGKLFDYSIANGIFNVKLEENDNNWKSYILETLEKINSISRKGFSFNILTSYSDEEYKKDYLYYADPFLYFDYCKRNFSKNIALLHDYDLYEFTILIRK